MTINVNHQSHEIAENSSLSNLLLEMNIMSKGIAVAVNNRVISKSQWEGVKLRDQDQITIIQATQGG